MILNKNELERLGFRLRNVVVESSLLLSNDDRQAVDHFLGVGEIEMAFESFILSLMEGGDYLSDHNRRELLSLGTALGLDRESVFRADFWQVAFPFLNTGDRK